MWDKIKTIIVTVLATLGVLFIIIMFIPDDEDEAVEQEVVETQAVQESLDDEEIQASSDDEEPRETTEDQEILEAQDIEEPQDTEDHQDIPEVQEVAETQNSGTVTVDIPASEISDKKLKFTTKTLDGKKVDQDIFSDYDITLVHVWGTFCGPCIAEMGKYANFYKNVPENVNLIGIICDVYDGIDSNVDDANDILSEAGAKFMNLRTSDSVYDVTDGISVVPTSFFVDGQGHIIGEMMIGQGYDAAISRLNGYLR
jgi:thiol-disulfide isomerase/thioredoxin